MSFRGKIGAWGNVSSKLVSVINSMNDSIIPVQNLYIFTAVPVGVLASVFLQGFSGCRWGDTVHFGDLLDRLGELLASFWRIVILIGEFLLHFGELLVYFHELSTRLGDPQMYFCQANPTLSKSSTLVWEPVHQLLPMGAFTSIFQYKSQHW